jgi:hypothetical protein
LFLVMTSRRRHCWDSPRLNHGFFEAREPKRWTTGVRCGQSSCTYHLNRRSAGKISSATFKAILFDIDRHNPPMITFFDLVGAPDSYRVHRHAGHFSVVAGFARFDLAILVSILVGELLFQSLHGLFRP